MKKILYCILPLLAVAACSKEQTVMPESEGVFSVVAETPAVTRTTIAPDGSDYKIWWKDGDKISAGSNNISAALSGVQPTGPVTFTFSKAVSAGDVVRCPGVANPSVVAIPSSQTSDGGQYDAAANPLWGTVTVSGKSVAQGKVVLNNTMAMLMFSLTGEASVACVDIESLGGQSINGNYSLNTSTGALTESGSNTAKTGVSFASPLALSTTPVDLYIPVRPQNYTKGFRLTLYEPDGKYMQVEFFKSGRSLTSSNLALFNIAFAASREVVDIDALAVLGSESASYDDDKPAGGLRVGTYNVWSDKDRTSKVGDRTDSYRFRTWDYAGDAVGALIAAMDCDVMGFNEISSNMYKSGDSASLRDAVETYTTDYTFSLNWPNSVDEHWWWTTTDFTYANGFCYKSSVLTLEDSGKFWLNSSGSTSDDSTSGGKRTCVWAKFTQKSTSKTFYFAISHLSIQSQGSDDGYEPGEWNLLTAKYLIKYLKTRTGASSSDRIILVGDMNSSNSTTNKGFKYIVNTLDGDANSTLPFTDSRDYLAGLDRLASSEKGLPGTSVGTWNSGAYVKSESHRYDHIMFRNVSVSNYKSYKKTFTVSADDTNTLWFPSDHLPVSVDVVL